MGEIYEMPGVRKVTGRRAADLTLFRRPRSPARHQLGERLQAHLVLRSVGGDPAVGAPPDGRLGAQAVGSRFLNGKRELSKSQVEGLRRLLGIPADVLLGLDG
ncbi:MAG: hypothetical protein RQ745_10670 [Longimicrobiales bacterium]|nr:hypothetical protein [Longimicrobiales bacterium]